MRSPVSLLQQSWKDRIHIAQVSGIVLAVVLSIVRVFVKDPPATRANTIAITMVGPTRTSLSNQIDSLQPADPWMLRESNL
jgi:hypothetical protein